jgi:putative DNA primase/helicase
MSYSADPAGAFRGAMAAAGIETPGPIVADGRLRRFHVEGDRRGTRNGWYVLHADELPAGAFGCWRRGLRETWHATPNGRGSPAERAQLLTRIEATRRDRDARDRELRERAARKAARLWNAARPADPAHPYLTSRGVKPHGIRQLGARLVIPVSAGGELRGLQFIDREGNKRYLTGTAKAGAYHPIGTAPAAVLAVAEGYATAATVHEATGWPVAVAFDCGNLLPAAQALRAKLPDDVRIVIAGDNDRATPGNPGATAAREAAAAVGGTVVLPRFADGEEGTDWNDVARTRGLEAVRLAIDPNGRRRWLYPDVLPLGIAGILASMGGAGKSRLIYQLGVSIAAGVPCIGIKPERVGGVLYLSAEDDEDELHRRGRRILAYYEAAGLHVDRGALAERLHVKSRVGLDNLLTRSGEDGEVHRTALVERIIALARLIPDLLAVAFDPVSRFRGGRANYEEDTTRFLETLEAIGQATGATVLAAAHVTKASIRDGGEVDQTAVRGSSALVDGARWCATLQRLRKAAAPEYGIDPDDARRYIRIEIPKSNYARPWPGMWLYLEAGGVLVPTVLEARTDAKAEARYADVLARVRSLLATEGPLSRRRVREYAGKAGILGAGDHTVRAVLERAVRDSELCEIDGALRLPEGAK